jgi:hypothetical protein
MADNLKVTFQTIHISNNGEWTGKGELYYSLTVDGALVASRSVNNPLKLADGEDIVLDVAKTVVKEAGQVLTVAGTVSEKDSLDKDDTQPFNHDYLKSDNWGFGPHHPRLVDGKLDVIVNYTIERA